MSTAWAHVVICGEFSRQLSGASVMTRAVRKSRIHDCRDYRDFRRAPWLLAIALVHVTAVNIGVLYAISVF